MFDFLNMLPTGTIFLVTAVVLSLALLVVKLAKGPRRVNYHNWLNEPDLGPDLSDLNIHAHANLRR